MSFGSQDSQNYTSTLQPPEDGASGRDRLVRSKALLQNPAYATFNVLPTTDFDNSRVPWADDTVIGAGVSRETGQLKPSAIGRKAASDAPLVSPPPPPPPAPLPAVPGGGAVIAPAAAPDPPPVVPKFSYEVLADAKDFSSFIAAEVKMSFKGVSAKGSAAFSSSRGIRMSSRSITATMTAQYVSDVLIEVPAQQVGGDSSLLQLTPEAADLLSDEGPSAFHAKYGTHYVAGFTQGGLLTAWYEMQFSSRSEKQRHKASIKSKVSGPAFRASASASVEAQLEEQFSVQTTRAGYEGFGWNTTNIPSSVTSLETLPEAVNGLEADGGRRLEAILSRYEDTPAYQEALRRYTGSDTYSPLPDSTSVILTEFINDQVLRYEFLSRDLLDENFKVTTSTGAVNPDEVPFNHALALEAVQLQADIQRYLGYDVEASANWLALAAYSGLEGPYDAEDGDLKERGAKLFKSLFRADELEGLNTADEGQFEVLVELTVLQQAGDQSGGPEFFGFVEVVADAAEGTESTKVKFDESTNAQTLFNSTLGPFSVLPRLVRVRIDEDDGSSKDNDVILATWEMLVPNDLTVFPSTASSVTKVGSNSGKYKLSYTIIRI